MAKVRRSLPTMFEEFSFTGEWWLPEDPDRRFAGALFYTPGSAIELKLVINPPFLPKRDSTNLIFGDVLEKPHRVVVVSTLKSYTIQHVDKDKTSISRQGFHPDYLLTGNWIHQTENGCIKLKEVNVAYSSLRGWMKSGISNQINEVSKALVTTKDLTNIDFNYTKSTNRRMQEFQIPSIDSIISLGARFDFEFTDSIDLHRTWEGHIGIAPNSPQSLAWYHEKFDSIRDLLSFLTGLPIASKRMFGVLNEVGSSADHVHIYHTVQPPILGETRADKMAFPLECLGDSISDVFETWFKLGENEKIPFELCLNVINSEGRYPILDFLALTHALESYHRDTFKKNPSLAVRLMELTKSLPKSLRDDLQLGNMYLETVEATRNYYSHYDPEIRKKNVILAGSLLNDAIRRLIPLISYHLARKLTISDEVIRQAFARIKRRGLWQRPWPKKDDKQAGVAN